MAALAPAGHLCGKGGDIRHVRILSMVLAALVLSTVCATVAWASTAKFSSGSLVNVTGTVLGAGSKGAKAWSMPLVGAKVQVEDTGQAAFADATGVYNLWAWVTSGPYYEGTVITASKSGFKSSSDLLSSDNPQVKDFTLRVKGTKVTIRIKSGGRWLQGAKVKIFAITKTTRADGRAYFSGLQLKPATKYLVTVTKRGYRMLKFKITSRPGGKRAVVKRMQRL